MATSSSQLQPLTLSPTKLKTFTQCPERYLRRYHVGPKRPEPPSRALARGTAVHRLLADHARRASTTPLTMDDLDDSVVPTLTAANYPPDADAFRDDDVAVIRRCLEWGIAEFDRRFADATVVAVEAPLDFTVRPPTGAGIQFQTAPDLVVLHPDGVLEHVDDKTGRFALDETQNLVARLVVGRNAAQLVGNRPFAGNEAIRTTALFLDEGQVWSRVFPRDEIAADWTALRQTATTMQAGLASPVIGVAPWQPRQNALCSFCPFVDVCSRMTSTAEDEALLAWLTMPAAAPVA
jgi:PD-(D/E)XK nuclease superfamily protein